MEIYDNENEDYEFFDDVIENEKYTADKKTVFLDTESNKIIDKKDLSPWDKITTMAAQLGTKINNPNNSCKKCDGKGYIGIDAESKTPVPCKCIFPPENRISPVNPKQNRKQKRQMEKNLHNMIKNKVKKPKEIAEEEKQFKKIVTKKKKKRKNIKKSRQFNRKKK